MGEDIKEIIGTEDGPTSIILSGVHGDETCGVEAMEHIFPKLQIKRGRVLWGYGNPRAIQQAKRFTETNLNRMFKPDSEISDGDRASYEYARAQFLKTYLVQADVLLDIHASFTPDTRPFLICEQNAKDIANHLPTDLVVHGFDEIEPGGTDYYMNRIGKIGICVECGYLGTPQAIVIAEQSIACFLRARGHLSGDLETQKQSHIRMFELYKTKTAEFRLSRAFMDFENLNKGEVIGLDGQEEIAAPRDSVILFARDQTTPNGEAFLLGEWQ